MMGLSTIQCLFAAVALFALIETGTCHKCYSCFGTSIAIPMESPIPGLPFTTACVDPVDTSKLSAVDCQGNEMVCGKLVKKENNVQVIMRTCIQNSACSGSCYSCKGDLCNGSSNLVPSFAVFTVISFILAKYFYA